MPKNTVVYSHGFGVRKDDRGLFTDIAIALPSFKHLQFDYNVFDEDANTLTARPFDKQVELLTKQLKDVDENSELNIIAHSQGCIVAALACPKNIRRIIFLAPPAQVLGLEKKEIYASRPETTSDEDGTMYMPRRDGSTTIIKEDYWKSREGILPIKLYNKLAEHTELYIITATKDEVLTNTDFGGLSPKVKLIKQDGNHDFTSEYRTPMIEQIVKILNY